MISRRHPAKGAIVGGSDSESTQDSFFTTTGSSPPIRMSDKSKDTPVRAQDYIPTDMDLLIEAVSTIRPDSDVAEHLVSIEGDLFQIAQSLDRIAGSLEKLEPKPPIGWYALVLCRVDEGDPLSLFDHGKVLGISEAMDTIWLRDFLGRLSATRLHAGDESDLNAFEVGPVEYFTTEDALVQALTAQHELENRRVDERRAAKRAKR